MGLASSPVPRSGGLACRWVGFGVPGHLGWDPLGGVQARVADCIVLMHQWFDQRAWLRIFGLIGGGAGCRIHQRCSRKFSGWNVLPPWGVCGPGGCTCNPEWAKAGVASGWESMALHPVRLNPGGNRLVPGLSTRASTAAFRAYSRRNDSATRAARFLSGSRMAWPPICHTERFTGARGWPGVLLAPAELVRALGLDGFSPPQRPALAGRRTSLSLSTSAGFDLRSRFLFGRGVDGLGPPPRQRTDHLPTSEGDITMLICCSCSWPPCWPSRSCVFEPLARLELPPVPVARY